MRIDSLVLRAQRAFLFSFLLLLVAGAGTLAQTPQPFKIKGSVSRFSTIDSSVEIKGKSATIREDKDTRQLAVPDRFFTISGYAPVTMQMMLVRYLNSHKASGAVATLPGGEVRV